MSTCATCIYGAPDEVRNYPDGTVICVNHKSLHYAVRIENIYSFGCSGHKSYFGTEEDQ